MPKLALEISELAIRKNNHSNFHHQGGSSTLYFGNSVQLCTKMMLPATQSSCLKNGHTIFQSHIVIATSHFGDFSHLYAKNDAASYS
jgi:hypothetical protein